MAPFQRDSVVRLHLLDNTTVEGRYLRTRRRYHYFTDGAIEADGKLREAKGLLLIPVANVKIAQVLG